ncbi:MAG: magnesium transporter, partial [Clostridia bacterium]|nr:magnesium transporter [Clostridia bacterium]
SDYKTQIKNYQTQGKKVADEMQNVANALSTYKEGGVSLSIVLTVLVAKFVGGLLPILADRIGIDPAVMASPLITTTVDVLSLLIYLSFASAVLGL